MNTGSKKSLDIGDDPFRHHFGILFGSTPPHTHSVLEKTYQQ